MKAAALLEALEDVANRLDVRVSYEPLAVTVGIGHGGLCRVRGQYRVIIDKRATTDERVATLARSLAKVATALGDAFAVKVPTMPAAVRDAIDAYADGGERTAVRKLAPGAAIRRAS